jgi:hypothetical protein
MTIKIAVLKSGEDVIADIKEMIVDEKVVGYLFEKPCVVNFRKSSEENTFDISMFPWIPVTKTLKIPVPTDWVVTVVDPIDQVEKMYVNDVIKNETNQTSISEQQRDSDISD